MVNLKKYDKLLFLKKNLDGSVDIVRKSQLYNHKENKILTIKNQFIWSWAFILTKLQSMDSRRFDIFQKIADKNLSLRKKKDDNRMHREIANFINDWEKIII